MKVYLNYCTHPLVLSHDALEMMGKPNYVTFLTSWNTKEIIITPLRSRRSDIGMTSITKATYEDGGAYAVAGTVDFLNEIRLLAGIKDKGLYSVEADPFFMGDLKAGQCGLARGLKIPGISLRLDMTKARIDFMEEYPIYTYGGYTICAG